MPRRSVQVCVRTRPTANFAQDELFVDPSSNVSECLNIHVPLDSHPL